MIGDKFNIYGPHSVIISAHANSIEAKHYGFPTLKLKNDLNKTNKTFKIIWSPFFIDNVILGNRTVNSVGRLYIYNEDERMLAEIVYNPKNAGGIFSNSNFKTDEFEGAIYKVSKEYLLKLQSFHSNPDYSKIQLKMKNYDIEEDFNIKARGVWH